MCVCVLVLHVRSAHGVVLWVGCVHSLLAVKGGQFSGAPHELRGGKRGLRLGTQDGKDVVEEN